MSKIKLIIFIFVILAIEPDSVKYLPIIIITFCIVNYKKRIKNLNKVNIIMIPNNLFLKY